MNGFKKQLKSSTVLFGTHVSLTEFAATEIFGCAGYDFVWIDTEHAGMDYMTLRAHINAARTTGMAVFVRASMNDPEHVKRILDMGVDGIIFPCVDDEVQAEKYIKATLYPPLGTRGCGPLGATRYGMESVANYIAAAQTDICRCIQIESATAIDNLPKLIQNEYIDFYILGPFDLSASIGRIGETGCPEVKALVKKAVDYLKANGKRVGVSTGATDTATFEYWIDLGIEFLSIGGDFIYLGNGAKSALENAKTAANKGMKK